MQNFTESLTVTEYDMTLYLYTIILKFYVIFVNISFSSDVFRKVFNVFFWYGFVPHISHLLTVSCSNFICWMSFAITAKRSLYILYILACVCWIVWAAKTLVRTTRERDGDCGISGREWQRGKEVAATSKKGTVNTALDFGAGVRICWRRPEGMSGLRC
jgi:hypothetical protein